MPAISAYAPGKIILFGEHAVVYHRPALAVPVTQVKVRVAVMANLAAKSGSIQIQAPDIHLQSSYDFLDTSHPLRLAVQSVLDELHVSTFPAMTIRITSSIPVAAGLGSGAAVSVAMLRGVSTFLGRPLADARVSALAYEIEKSYHGTPSGIDNTVITYAKPIFFIRDAPLETLQVPTPFLIIIADTGIKSPTATAVSEVRRRWQVAPTLYEGLFDQVGEITRQARLSIEQGHPDSLGPLMIKNHHLLQQVGVSCPELDCLVEAALSAGASGAKLSGGGMGGNMIALTTDDRADQIAQALTASGAVRTITTRVQNPPPKTD